MPVRFSLCETIYKVIIGFLIKWFWGGGVWHKKKIRLDFGGSMNFYYRQPSIKCCLLWSPL